jgi:hypothetical protein
VDGEARQHVEGQDADGKHVPLFDELDLLVLSRGRLDPKHTIRKSRESI